MIVLPPVYEISLVGVADRGVPNRERIVLRPTETINLAFCGIVLGYKKDEIITPLNDHFFWFGDQTVKPPSWLVVYTGPGTSKVSTIPGTQQTAHTFHWGKPTTVFDLPEIVPVVFKFGGIISAPVGTPSPPPNQSWPSLAEALTVGHDKGSLGPLARILEGGTMPYRRKKGADAWHWCRNCSNWPTSAYDEQQSKPSSGELCNQCRSKTDNKDCTR